MSVAFERIDELLSQRTTEGLSAAETVELDQLIRHYASFDSEALERAAAAVAVTMLERFEPLPTARQLRGGDPARLQRAAENVAKFQMPQGRDARCGVLQSR